MLITDLYDFMSEKIIFCVDKLLKVSFILISSSILTHLIKKSFKSVSKSDKFDITFVYFLQSSLLVSLRVLTFIIVLNIFGININNLLTLIGAVGVSLGLVFKDSLVSAASGFIIIFNRTIRAGDIVKVGEIEGLIKEIQLMQTIIKTEKENVIIPNNYFVNNFIKIIK